MADKSAANPGVKHIQNFSPSCDLALSHSPGSRPLQIQKADGTKFHESWGPKAAWLWLWLCQGWPDKTPRCWVTSLHRPYVPCQAVDHDSHGAKGFLPLGSFEATHWWWSLVKTFILQECLICCFNGKEKGYTQQTSKVLRVLSIDKPSIPIFWPQNQILVGGFCWSHCSNGGTHYSYPPWNLKIGQLKMKGSSPNHPFSGAMLVLWGCVTHHNSYTFLPKTAIFSFITFW